jgi:SPX domain protein involved in polyphosphate accumulation
MSAPIRRYELKYLLPVRQLADILEDLRGLAEPDPHSGTQGYRVVSLYYDSPDLDCFWAKIEGIRMRRKLRLRVYPNEVQDPPGMGWVEIKQRINRVVRKRRLALALPDAERLCTGQWPDEALTGQAQQVASEVMFLVGAMRLEPAAITAYRRQAFVSSGPGRPVRITFDQDCRGRVRELEIRREAVDSLFLPVDWCVMEVKVDETVPDWVTSMLARHGCQLRRISKYCAALAHGRGIRVEPLAVWPAADPGEPVHG